MCLLGTNHRRAPPAVSRRDVSNRIDEREEQSGEEKTQQLICRMKTRIGA